MKKTALLVTMGRWEAAGAGSPSFWAKIWNVEWHGSQSYTKGKLRHENVFIGKAFCSLCVEHWGVARVLCKRSTCNNNNTPSTVLSTRASDRTISSCLWCGPKREQRTQWKPTAPCVDERRFLGETWELSVKNGYVWVITGEGRWRGHSRQGAKSA